MNNLKLMKGGKMKREISLIVATIFFISMISMVSAATTLVKPTASSYQTTSMIVNCTTTATDCAACRNATIWYNASGGAAQTALTILTNDSADDIEFYSAGVSIAALTDGATYNFSCKVDNGTSQSWSAGRAGIVIDNTNPTLDVKESSVTTTAPINYKCSDTNIATFTLVHKNSAGTNVTETLQQSTSNYVQFLTTVADTYRFTCTDSAGNSATDSVVVSEPTGYAIPSAKAIPAGTSENFLQKEVFKLGTFSIKMWLLLLIAAGVVYWMYQKK